MGLLGCPTRTGAGTRCGTYPGPADAAGILPEPPGCCGGTWGDWGTTNGSSRGVDWADPTRNQGLKWYASEMLSPAVRGSRKDRWGMLVPGFRLAVNQILMQPDTERSLNSSKDKFWPGRWQQWPCDPAMKLRKDSSKRTVPEALRWKLRLGMETPSSRNDSSVACQRRIAECRSGIVVLGACGLLPSAISFRSGRRRASKVYADPVCFWRRKFHVPFKRSTCHFKIKRISFRKSNLLSVRIPDESLEEILVARLNKSWIEKLQAIRMIQMYYLGHGQSQQDRSEGVHVSKCRFALDGNFNPVVEHGCALLDRRANQDRYGHKQAHALGPAKIQQRFLRSILQFLQGIASAGTIKDAVGFLEKGNQIFQRTRRWFYEIWAILAILGDGWEH